MKNFKIFLILICAFFSIQLIKAQSLQRTYSQVHTELVNAGYSLGTAPTGYPASWSGATLYFYHKSGTTGVVVYAYSSQSDIPTEAKNECDKKAYVENGIEKCNTPGTECKVVVKTASNGETYGVELICCG